MDNRHLIRITIVQQLFAKSYHSRQRINSKTALILKNVEKIDKLISHAAFKYKSDRIAPVDLAILRLALYEMIIENKQPDKVIINEAIELGKEMGGNNSPSFINAILGKILDQKKLVKKL